jgi:hypothetical protein
MRFFLPILWRKQINEKNPLKELSQSQFKVLNSLRVPQLISITNTVSIVPAFLGFRIYGLQFSTRVYQAALPSKSKLDIRMIPVVGGLELALRLKS